MLPFMSSAVRRRMSMTSEVPLIPPGLLPIAGSDRHILPSPSWKEGGHLFADR